MTSFNITHSYFSSPVTCSTKSTKFYSPFPRDKIFGSLGKAFTYKWQGNGFAHPHTEKDAHQALHWTRLAAMNNPTTITILAIPNANWYHNFNSYIGPFPDAHVITHFPADTITYEEPTIPPELKIVPRTKPSAQNILFVFITKILM